MSYLQITLQVAPEHRAAAGGVYAKYRDPFLDTIEGATDKQLLMRDEDVQVLHTFTDGDAAAAYLTTELFNNDVVRELGPLLSADPDVRIYDEA
jgi:hypothetical protein